MGWGNPQVVRYSGDNVVQGGDQHLWVVAGCMPAERVEEVVTPRNLHLHTIDREDTVSLDLEEIAEVEVELLGGMMDEGEDHLGGDLLASYAECRGGDGLFTAEVDAEGTTLIPEGVEQRPVSSPPGVGNHVKDESEHEAEV